MGQRELGRALKQARAIGRKVAIPELRRGLRSRAPQRRLLALAFMRDQLERGVGPAAYLQLARPIVRDSSSDCRWQALIVIGHFIPSDPMAVWRVVLHHGPSANPDVRAGVATVLLEHLLEYDARRFVPLVEAAVSRRQGAFADTVARCWSFKNAKGHRAVKKLIKRARLIAPAA